MPAPIRLVLADFGRADDSWVVLVGDLLLFTNLLPLKIAELCVVDIHKLPELLAQVRCVDYLLPFALVSVHLRLHARIELLAEPQLVIDHHLLQIFDAALEALQPFRGACQRVCSEGVVHEDAVHILESCVVIKVLLEEKGVLGRGAMVPADVEVVPLHGRHKPHVLALRLRALSHASRDPHLELVRSAKSLVALLYAHGHRDGVLLTEAAPGSAYATLHGAERFPIGVAALHPLGLDLHCDFPVLALERAPTIADVLPDGW
mmetsp:Transcript_10675/g.22470  ORF Transcript_10675/g.22470 Transcript_10675/m.22470 type:complete len:262 (-) Transcript_10675:2711-3496(-)